MYVPLIDNILGLAGVNNDPVRFRIFQNPRPVQKEGNDIGMKILTLPARRRPSGGGDTLSCGLFSGVRVASIFAVAPEKLEENTLSLPENILACISDVSLIMSDTSESIPALRFPF